MDRALLPEGIIESENRTARMSVLAWHPNDGKALNLFTHIRHRRIDKMGPWAGEPDQIWRTTELPASETAEAGEFRLHYVDATLSHCLQMVEDILDKNALVAGGIEVWYDLEQPARTHWAYRNCVSPEDHSVSSPFKKHSARVTEFWSFAPDPLEHWQKACDSYTSAQLDRTLGRLGLRLDQRPDRVGNLMISGAADEVTCELVKEEHHLIFRVGGADGNELPINDYSATIWAGDSDDDLAHRHVSITERDTVISISSAVDCLGFAIFRRSDGQCIDLWDGHLIREIGIALNVTSGQTLEIHDPRRGTTNTVGIGNANSVIEIGDERSDAVDGAIRQAMLRRKSWQRDREARQEGNLGRFGPDQTEQAIDFFLNLLTDHWRSDEPIYLADPYFMQRDLDNTNERMYSSMFGLTRGRQLRILCGQPGQRQWLSQYPLILTGHVAVKSFTSKDGQGQDKPSFHDRYLITPDREIIITHSVNGWHDQGVTFAALPYGVYRAEAEQLWALNVGHNSNGVRVQEVKK